MLHIHLTEPCQTIWLKCLLENPLNGKRIFADVVLDTGCSKTTVSKDVASVLGLPYGAEGSASCGGGDTLQYDSHCIVRLSPSDNWELDINIMPTLPVPALIGMDIISDGNLTLTHKSDGYYLTYEKL